MSELAKYNAGANPFAWLSNKLEKVGGKDGMLANYHNAMMQHQSHMALADKQHGHNQEMEAMKHENAKEILLYNHVISQKAEEAKMGRLSEFHQGTMKDLTPGTNFSYQYGDVKVSGTKAPKETAPVKSQVPTVAPVPAKKSAKKKGAAAAEYTPLVGRGKGNRFTSLKNK